MRISKKMNGGRKGTVRCGQGLISNSADRRVAAAAANGTGQCSIVSPGGISYIPRAMEDAVVISDGSERYCIGVRIGDNDHGILPGELILYTPSSYIHLKNNGEIRIVGDVYINGTKLEVT